MTTFDLPDLGEGLVEVDIVRWLVAPGDEVKLNQPIAEVETAKAVVEIPSPVADVVGKLHGEVGDTIEVGMPFVTFGSDAGGIPEPQAPEAPETPVAPEPTLVGYGAAASRGRPKRRRRRAVAVAAAPVRSTAGQRPRATPPVRVHAKRRGVDLEALAADVGDRIITRQDVDRAADAVGLGEGRGVAEEAGPKGETIRVPVSAVRRATAQAMVQSAFTAPHATVFNTVDVTETKEFIARLREDPAQAEHHIGLLALVAKAVCLGLRATPELNASWDDEHEQILRFGSVNLGIAAATDRGLLVPNIHGAQALSLAALADALRELAQTARAGKTTPQSLANGTFSITNVGVFGVETGAPILPPGQAGILSVGAVRRLPWEHQGGIALRDVMTLSLSFDHRVVDGAEASRFLTSVSDLLRSPAEAMLWV